MQLYLIYDHFALEHRHKVSWFLSHCCSDLDWLVTVLLIQDHCLKC